MKIPYIIINYIPCAFIPIHNVICAFIPMDNFIAYYIYKVVSKYNSVNYIYRNKMKFKMQNINRHRKEVHI